MRKKSFIFSCKNSFLFFLLSPRTIYSSYAKSNGKSISSPNSAANLEIERSKNGGSTLRTHQSFSSPTRKNNESSSEAPAKPARNVFNDQQSPVKFVKRHYPEPIKPSLNLDHFYNQLSLNDTKDISKLSESMNSTRMESTNVQSPACTSTVSSQNIHFKLKTTYFDSFLSLNRKSPLQLNTKSLTLALWMTTRRLWKS